MAHVERSAIEMDKYNITQLLWCFTITFHYWRPRVYLQNGLVLIYLLLLPWQQWLYSDIEGFHKNLFFSTKQQEFKTQNFSVSLLSFEHCLSIVIITYRDNHNFGCDSQNGNNMKESPQNLPI